MSTALRTSARALSAYLSVSRQCPTRCRAVAVLPCTRVPRQSNTTRRRGLSTDVSHSTASAPLTTARHDSKVTLSEQQRFDATKRLPKTCAGCGAFTQTTDPGVPGYFDLTIARNLKLVPGVTNVPKFKAARRAQDDIYREALARLGGGTSTTTPTAIHGSDQTAASSGSTEASSNVPATTSVCDRCHLLKYQHAGSSVVHPSLHSIQAMIEDSPHKYNHIYHVIDAADFPMSLVPNLTSALHLPRLRTQNRRSKSTHFLRGRLAEISFIISRSDLLAPQKEQVDRLLPYLREILRDALAKTNRKARLGNVRCVSAKRGWWTREVKEEIWQRGGAGWMVGKVNVGKSALYEAVFPKGRGQDIDTNVDRLRQQSQGDALSHILPDEQATPFGGSTILEDDPAEEVILDEDDDTLLPPPQKETAYPEMPTVSNLPGTTASPIRIPYGSGKGELIDLPGIDRSSLQSHVKVESHSDMIMKGRVTPEQLTIKPGQSLLLGGVIRVTPRLAEDEDLIFLAHAFMPRAFNPHVTATYKAIAIQTGQHSHLSEGREGSAYEGTVPSIATEEAKKRTRSAGVFELSWDMTRRRAGALTASDAAGIRTERLPFQIYSADILIEGVGWLELACQVRKRRQDALSVIAPEEGPSIVPKVEIFSPEGKYVDIRKPMNGSILCAPRKKVGHVRPRQSIGMKKRQQASQATRFGRTTRA